MESSSGHRSSRGGSLAHWLRGLFSADAFGHTKRARRRITGHSSRRLRFESCEDRRLLSIGVLFDSGTGELELTGTSSTDQVSVVGQRNYLDIYVGGTFQARLLDANYNTVSTISFFGGDGDDSLVVQNVQPTGALTLDLTEAENLSVLRSRNVTVTSDAALNLGSASISGTLAITSGGELTQTGQVVVAKETTLDASGNDITLTYAANNFGKAVTIVSAQNVSLRDVNAIVLDDLNVSGDLTIQANLNSTGRTAISQASGTSILVDGATTLTVGPASTVTLKNSGNQLTGTVSFTGATVTLTNDLATELGHSSVTRNLRLTSGGAVTQIDSLIVGQTATISAAGFGIDLSADGNDFRIAALTGADVLINDLNALVLGKSTITGTLDITVDGAITQSSTLTVAGALTLTAGETNNITLTKSSNDFASVEIISACDVALRDKNELELAESIVSGNLTVTTAGDLTQSGILTVNGKTTLTAGSSHDILLATYDNDFGELRIVSGGNVEISDVGELVLGTSRISGTLDVHTDGSLTQSGALTVRGSATLIVDDGDLLLDHASNNFATGVSPRPSATRGSATATAWCWATSTCTAT